MEKIIDITERVPAMRKKRKRRTNIKFIILTLIFLSIILLLLYFKSSYSLISSITVKGNHLQTEEQYLEQLKLAKGDSLWSFDQDDLEKKLLSYDWIKDAEVKRKWLNKVSITIKEWQKVGYISQLGSFNPILENGVIYDASDKLMPIDAPIFLDFEEDDLRKKILKALTKVNPEVMTLISQINASPTKSDPYAITLFMNDGYEVRAEINTLAEKLNYYPSIIAQIESNEVFEKGIIDIEVGSYYRPFSGEYGDGVPIQLGEEGAQQPPVEETIEEPVEEPLEETVEEPVPDSAEESLPTEEEQQPQEQEVTDDE